MYAAHKAAGGMTSIYRQLGVGCEQLFRAIIQDALQLSPQQVAWSYQVEKQDGSKATLTLDARIDVGDIRNATISMNMAEWLRRSDREIALKSQRKRIL